MEVREVCQEEQPAGDRAHGSRLPGMDPFGKVQRGGQDDRLQRPCRTLSGVRIKGQKQFLNFNGTDSASEIQEDGQKDGGNRGG